MKRRLLLLALLFGACILAGCQERTPVERQITDVKTPAPTLAPSPTIEPTPTPTPVPKTVALDQRAATLGKGGGMTLSAAASETVDAPIQWASSDESVATVDQQGRVTGVKKGVAAITAQAGEAKATCYVSVSHRAQKSPLGDIEPPRYELAEGVYRNKNAVDTGSATLMLAGDLMCLTAQQNAVSNGNFNKSFSYVRKVFEKSDFAIGNLETLISSSNPYTREEIRVNNKPNCNGPATYLDAVRYANFDAVITNNNHSLDGGMQGIVETFGMLDAYGLIHTGTFLDENTQRFLLADVNGIRVAILSYSELYNQRSLMSGEEQALYLNPYSLDTVKRDVAAAKAAGAEFIVAYNHWGVESTHKLTSDQKSHAKEMADAGVDVIAGSHPHCLQEAAWIDAADGRRVLCVYSMGNFVSSMGDVIHNDTIILKLDLQRQQDGVKLASAGYLGARVHSSYQNGRHVIVPVSSDLNGGASSSTLKSAQSRINGVMGDAIEEVTTLD